MARKKKMDSVRVTNADSDVIVVPELEALVGQVRNKPWSHADIDTLRRYYGKMPTKNLAQTLGRSRASVNLKAVQCGISFGDAARKGMVLILALISLPWLMFASEIETRTNHIDTATCTNDVNAWTIIDVETVARLWGCATNTTVAMTNDNFVVHMTAREFEFWKRFKESSEYVLRLYPEQAQPETWNEAQP